MPSTTLTGVLTRFFRRNHAKTPTVLFFAPHQDDELLTMGIHACRTNKDNLHVFLCTDGSKSGVRRNLCNRRGCSLHKGVHSYTLTIEEFVEARDNEFRTSCAALGYVPGSVHISPLRCLDGELTVDAAKRIILDALSQFPDARSICTISPYGGAAQHTDHTHLGQAALSLYEEGILSEVTFFVEPYCVQSCREAYPDLQLTDVRADKKTAKKLMNAVHAYSDWDPDNQRFAIGRHSVSKSFDDFMKEPTAYFHICRK